MMSVTGWPRVPQNVRRDRELLQAQSVFGLAEGGFVGRQVQRRKNALLGRGAVREGGHHIHDPLATCGAKQKGVFNRRRDCGDVCCNDDLVDVSGL